MNPALIAPLVLIAVGTHLTFSFGRDLYFGLASRGWARVPGRICRLGTDAGSTMRGDEALAVVYDYHVGGVAYRSNRYDYAGRNSHYFRDLYLTLSVGDDVSVWYDPSEPTRAVLVPGIERGNVLRILFGLAFLYLGLASLP